MILRNQSIGFHLALCLVCLLLGCGEDNTPPLGTVSGVVTLDGKPLENVVVYFEPEKGRTSSGFTDSDGHYELDYTKDKKGAIAGQHTVRITTQESLHILLGEAETDDVERPKPIPEKYNTTSTLTAEVKPGSNAFDFKLQAVGH